MASVYYTDHPNLVSKVARPNWFGCVSGTSRIDRKSTVKLRLTVAPKTHVLPRQPAV